MKFRIEHVFTNISQSAYEELYFDEPFNEAMCKALKLERELIERTREGDNFRRVVRVTADRQIPGPLAKLVGGAKLEYTEIIDYQWGSFTGRWRSDSAILPDKIESGGTFGFDKRGDDVCRWLAGEIKAKIFGLGGILEKFVVADIEKSYGKAAEFTHTWRKR